MSKLDELKKDWLKNPDVEAEYEALEKEFSTLEANIRACVERR